MKKLTFIRLLLITINCRRNVYEYEDDGFKEEQCMKTEERNKCIYLVKKM